MAAQNGTAATKSEQNFNHKGHKGHKVGAR